MPVKSYPDANPPDPADKVPDESVAAPFPEKLVARVEAARFDPDHPPPDEPWAFQLAGVEIAHSGNLITIAASIVLLAAVAFLMRKTTLGIAMRAAATNFTMARMLGVPANLIITSAFALSGFLAGVVGLLWIGRIGTVVPGVGLEPLLVAFIATVIGGMRSLPGAVVGGFLLALIDTTLNYTLSQDLLKFRDAFTFSLVILILLWRPEGLIKGPASGQRT